MNVSKPKERRSDVLNVLYESWRDESKGQRILVGWVAGLVTASLCGIYIKRRMRALTPKPPPKITRKQPSSFLLSHSNPANTDEKDDESTSDVDDEHIEAELDHITPSDNFAHREGTSGLLRLAMPSVISAPILWGLLLGSSLLWKTSLVSEVNDSIGVLGELLVHRQWRQLSLATMDFAVKTAWCSLSTSAVELLTDLLSLSLRDAVSMALRRGLRPKAIYLVIHEQNGDQTAADIAAQLTSETAEWARAMANSFVALLRPMMAASVYSSKLLQRIGARSLCQCLGYLFISALWTRMVFPSAAQTKSAVLRSEALYSADLRRFVEFAEEVHLLRGGTAELRLLDASYCALYGEVAALCVERAVASLASTYAVRYLGILASFVALLPTANAEAKPTEFLLNALHDLVHVGLAARDLLRGAKDLQNAQALSTRILGLHTRLRCHADAELGHCLDLEHEHSDAMIGGRDAMRSDRIRARSEMNGNGMNVDIYKDDSEMDDDDDAEDALCGAVVFKEARIETPDGLRVLVDALSVRLSLGQNVLVCGANGAGKSSLLRAVSGLWRCGGGSIEFGVAEEALCFVPARAYLLPSLSVKEQLRYPSEESGDDEVSDESVVELLSECGLGKMVEFVSVEQIGEARALPSGFWATLSDGEKQLIALCRALLRRPQMLFLDEALCHLSRSRVEWFFKRLAADGVTAVTITHTPDLVRQYHHAELTLNADAKGSYSFEILQR